MRKSLYCDEQIVDIVRESYEHGVAATPKKYKVSKDDMYLAPTVRWYGCNRSDGAKAQLK